MTRKSQLPGHLLWVAAAVTAVTAVAVPVFAQTAPTGHVSVFLDHLPNRDATELRARAFAEQKLEAGQRMRLTASGFVEGLVADRKGAVTDALFEPQELTIAFRAKRFTLSAGLGRVVWGRLDELQPTDVVNPIDVSRFFLEGRSEARLSLPLVRATVYAGDTASVEAVYVPFFRRGRFDRLAEGSSPFNLIPGGFAPDPPVLSLAGAAVSIVDKGPSRTAANAQGGARLNVTSGRVDWSVSAYRGFRPVGLYAAASPARIDRVYPRFSMLGGDIETVAGTWVVRGEVAVFPRDAFQAPDRAVVLGGRSFDAGAGVDRKAGDYRVSGQVLVHRERYDAGPHRTDVSLIVSADRSFARQKYTGRLFGIYNPKSGAGFVRGIATVSLRDNLGLESSVGWFGRRGLDTIGRFADRDFVYLRLKYFF